MIPPGRPEKEPEPEPTPEQIHMKQRFLESILRRPEILDELIERLQEPIEDWPMEELPEVPT